MMIVNDVKIDSLENLRTRDINRLLSKSKYRDVILNKIEDIYREFLRLCLWEQNSHYEVYKFTIAFKNAIVKIVNNYNIINTIHSIKLYMILRRCIEKKFRFTIFVKKYGKIKVAVLTYPEYILDVLKLAGERYGRWNIILAEVRYD